MAKYQMFGEQKSFQGQSSVKGESQSLLYPNVVELGGLSKTMKDKALRLPSVVDSDIMLKLQGFQGKVRWNLNYFLTIFDERGEKT